MPACFLIFCVIGAFGAQYLCFSFAGLSAPHPDHISFGSVQPLLGMCCWACVAQTPPLFFRCRKKRGQGLGLKAPIVEAWRQLIPPKEIQHKN